MCVCFLLLYIQLYTQRAMYLKGREKEYWDFIDPSFMSEESAYESEGELVMYRHTILKVTEFSCYSYSSLSNSYTYFIQVSTNKLRR